MSQENVEIVKRCNAALNRGDVNAALEAFAPNATVRDLQSGPDQPTVVEGTEAMREVWALWLDAFAELQADVREFIEADDAVICDVHWAGRGKASGMTIDVDQFDVYEIADEAVVRATLGYKSKAEALEAVGLRE
jgi:ketosteroid isomerase-like protein